MGSWRAGPAEPLRLPLERLIESVQGSFMWDTNMYIFKNLLPDGAVLSFDLALARDKSVHVAPLICL